MRKPDVLSWELDHSNSSCDNKDVVLIKPEFLVVYVIKGLVFKEVEHSPVTELVSKKN